MMDGNGPYRNVLGFIGLLLVGKALPDMIFSVLKYLLKMRGGETLDYGMMGLDVTFVAVGAGVLWAAFTYMGPPEVPEEVMEDDPMLRMLPRR